MQELIEYLEAENAKSQAEMDANPNVWIGLTTTDPKHWEDCGITTVLDFKKYCLANTISEASKSAYGSRYRVDWTEMSIEELQKEADSFCEAAQEEYEREKKFEAEQVEEFKTLVMKTIELGAGDEETALRWLTEGEKWYHEQDLEHWVYNHNILFTDYGKELVKKLENIKPYLEWKEAA